MNTDYQNSTAQVFEELTVDEQFETKLLGMT
jgi:hypothetical protein